MGDGLGEIRVIHAGAAMGAEVRNGVAAAGKQFVDGGFKFQRAVVGADSDTQGALCLRGSCSRRMGCGITHGVGVNKMKDGRYGPAQDVTGAQVRGEALADGIGDLRGEGGVEFAH